MKKYVVTIASFLLCVVLAGCFGFVNHIPGRNVVPPAGTYYVSSIGTEDGDVVLYSTITNQIMIVNEDGEGSFYYEETFYSIAFEKNTMTVNDEPIEYTFIASSTPEESMLILYWNRNGTISIVLRPVPEV